jgi:hypothetical protein
MRQGKISVTNSLVVEEIKDMVKCQPPKLPRNLSSLEDKSHARQSGTTANGASGATEHRSPVEVGMERGRKKIATQPLRPRTPWVAEVGNR